MGVSVTIRARADEGGSSDGNIPCDRGGYLSGRRGTRAGAVAPPTSR